MFGRNGISARRLSVLIRHLPADSATARALGAPSPGEPTGADLLTLDLLAILADLVNAGNFYFVKANTKQGAYVKAPESIPRLWRDDKQDGPRQQSTPTELASFFGDRIVVRYTPKTEEP